MAILCKEHKPLDESLTTDDWYEKVGMHCVICQQARIVELEEETDAWRDYINDQIEWDEAWRCGGCEKVFPTSTDPGCLNDEAGEQYCGICFEKWMWRCTKCSWRFVDETEVCTDCGAKVQLNELTRSKS